MDNLLTITDVCKIFAISRRTLERWRNKGLPETKVGLTVRFRKEDIEKWIAAHTDNKELLKLDISRLVLGAPGSGKTVKGVIPILKNWKGSALVIDSCGRIFRDTTEDRLKYGLVVPLNLTENLCPAVMDTIERGQTGYITYFHETSNITEYLDKLFIHIIDNYSRKYPVLVVVEDLGELQKINCLNDILRRARMCNVFFLITMQARSSDEVFQVMKGKGYNDEEIRSILVNCDMVNLSEKPCLSDEVEDREPEKDKIDNLILELAKQISGANGMTRYSMQLQLGSIIKSMAKGYKVIIVDPKSEYGTDISKKLPDNE